MNLKLLYYVSVRMHLISLHGVALACSVITVGLVNYFTRSIIYTYIIACGCIFKDLPGDISIQDKILEFPPIIVVYIMNNLLAEF